MFSRPMFRNPRRKDMVMVKVAIGATKEGDSLGDYKMISRPPAGVEAVDIIASGYEWICSKCETLNRFMEIPSDAYMQCGECGNIDLAGDAEHAYS